MKNWFKILLIIGLLSVAFSISYYFFFSLPAANTHAVVQEASLSQPNVYTTDLSFLEALYSQVFAYNLGYVSLSVVIILALGAMYTFFNVKPMQDKINQHEATLTALETQAKADLEVLRRDLEDENSNLEKALTEKSEELINSIRSEFNSFVEKQKEVELDSIYNLHYLWYATEIYANDLDALIEFLEKSIEYKITHSIRIALVQVDRVLSEVKFSVASLDRAQRLHMRLSKILPEIEGLNELKKTITDKMHVILDKAEKPETKEEGEIEM